MTPDRITLKGKVVAFFSLFLVTVLGLCLIFFYGAVRSELERENLSRMAAYAASFERSFSRPEAEGGGLSGLAARAAEGGEWPGRVTLMDGDGTVRFDSAGPGGMDNHIQRPEIQEALRSGAGSALRYSATSRAYMHYYALRAEGPGERVVFIRVAYPISALSPILGAFVRRAVFAVSAIALVSLLFWTWLTKRLFRPLDEIVRRAGRVGASDARFPIFRDVELQKLSESLNTMSERLRSANADILSRREELARIVEALPVGVVLTDADRRVRYANDAARRLLGGEGEAGSPVERLIPNGEIYDMLDGPDGRGTVFLIPPPTEPEGEALSVEVSVISLAAGRLMTLQDVTEERRLEETRRNFTIEAGHELQTPLTAIRAAAELLLEDENAEGKTERESLLAAILRQQERMTSLIDDLLLLAKLESAKGKSVSAERAPEDLAELLNEAAEEFRGNPAARAVAFETVVPGPAPVLADRPELLRAISNIADNAARKCGEKYGSRPGGRVRLSLAREGAFWVITIADNGPGVDPEAASRIFKSFRASGRRGKWGSGGHGLGLFIAARVAESHGGVVDLLPSSPLGGAAFEIRLPVKPEV
jgi:two-component system phosphate regulon sensor histidine kinase PhoR